MCRQCLVEIARAARSDAGRVVHDPGRRGPGRPHRDRQRQARPGRRARAVPRQPSARLPGLRQGRRVPAAGPDDQPRSRREPLRRAEAPLREADPDQRPGLARPRALHPVRPLHALRRRGRRRQADPLRQSQQRHPGADVPRRAVRVVLLRQHRADLPGRRAHRHAVPVQGQAVGPRAGREHVHDVLGRLPGRDPVEPRRVAALPGRRLRPGQLGMAVRPGPVRLRGGQLRRAPRRPAGAWRVGPRRDVVERRARRSPRRSFARRSTPVGRTRSGCSAVLAARTRMRTRGPSSPTRSVWSGATPRWATVWRPRCSDSIGRPSTKLPTRRRSCSSAPTSKRSCRCCTSGCATPPRSAAAGSSRSHRPNRASRTWRGRASRAVLDPRQAGIARTDQLERRPRRRRGARPRGALRRRTSAIGVLGGARGTNEDAFTWAQLADALGIVHRDAQLGDGLPTDLLGLDGPPSTRPPTQPRSCCSAPISRKSCRCSTCGCATPPRSDAAGSSSSRRSNRASRTYAWKSVRYEPGGAARVDRRDRSPSPRCAEQLAKGNVVVVAGRANLAESQASAVASLAALLAAVPGAKVLPALRRGNVVGALELGLRPPAGDDGRRRADDGLASAGGRRGQARPASCCSEPIRSTTAPTSISPAGRLAGARRVLVDRHVPHRLERQRRRRARGRGVRREVGHDDQPRGAGDDGRPEDHAGRHGAPRLDDRRRAGDRARPRPRIRIRRRVTDAIAADGPRLRRRHDGRARDATRRHRSPPIPPAALPDVVGERRATATRYDYRLAVSRKLYDNAVGTSRSPSLAALAPGAAAHVHPARLRPDRRRRRRRRSCRQRPRLGRAPARRQPGRAARHGLGAVQPARRRHPRDRSTRPCRSPTFGSSGCEPRRAARRSIRCSTASCCGRRC